MSTYAIGDVQGCFSSLQKLLDKIHFDPQQDMLWFTGDLVNRGPQSLQTLRFIKELGGNQITVLGNHDLHLLALTYGAPAKQEDTLCDILTAPDRDELMHWLSHQPLLHHDAALGYTMVHAGLAPSWNLDIAQQLAQEVERVLRSPEAPLFYQHMYGNEPDHWDPTLTGWARLRCITNYLTRVRFCYPDGRIDLKSKGTPLSSSLIPWFDIPERAHANLKIIFGHWAALNGVTHHANILALDTGCVWGNCLTALRLEDEARFSVPCQ